MADRPGDKAFVSMQCQMCSFTGDIFFFVFCGIITIYSTLYIMVLYWTEVNLAILLADEGGQ